MMDRSSDASVPESAPENDASRLAVVLFNLGGPDRPEAVRPFLRNLFLDPAILPVPAPVRAVLARWIAWKRALVTQEIYRQIGGKSPLPELTEHQARELEKALKTGKLSGKFETIQTFTAMRYWHPRAGQVVADVKAFNPSMVVLLPLYPQFSSTTSQTSIDEWKREAVRQKLIAATRAQCCYPVEKNFVAAHVSLIREALEKVPDGVKPRLLFSAHGLPVQTIESGDPYQMQVERTVAAVVQALGVDGLDFGLCYQSRVTRQEWIGPSTEDEIVRAGQAGLGLIVIPIAFVSEHSETLVELDVEYRDLATRAGAACYIRVPALGTHEAFIGALGHLIEGLALGQEDFAIRGPEGYGPCPEGFGRCPCRIRQHIENKEVSGDG